MPSEGDHYERRFREADAAGDTAGMAAARTAMAAYVDRMMARQYEVSLAELRRSTAGTCGWWGDDPEAGWVEYGPSLDPDDTPKRYDCA